MLNEMEPQVIDMGISVTEYWSMTFGEIMYEIESFKRKEKKRLEEKAYFSYKEAYLNSYAFNDPSKTPKFEDIFEFVKENKDVTDTTEDKQDKQIVTQAPEWKLKQIEMMQQAVRARLKKQGEVFEDKMENGGES